MWQKNSGYHLQTMFIYFLTLPLVLRQGNCLGTNIFEDKQQFTLTIALFIVKSNHKAALKIEICEKSL
jgi:hypothetical protein